MLALALFLFLFVPAASAMAPKWKEEPPEVFEGVGTGALNITEPANGGAYKTAPLYYNGGASLNFTAYTEDVFLRLEEFTIYGFADPQAFASESVVIRDFEGYWLIESKHFESRWTVYSEDSPSSELPNGTPLEEGKYLLKAVQICDGGESLACALEEENSANLHARIEFWVDGRAPETEIESATPVGQATSSTSRAFRLSAIDPQPDPYGLPSGVRDVECSLDGGKYVDCASSLSVKVTNTTTGTVTHRVQFDREQCEPALAGAEEGLPRDCLYKVENLKEGEHTLKVRSVDGAGNVDATPATSSWIVDLTPPNITIAKPADRAHYLLGQNVPADYSCEDPISNGVASGIAKCEGTVPEGSPIDTSTLGPHEFTVEAEDKAGNKSKKTVAYVVDSPRYGDLVGGSDPLAYYRLGEPVGSTTMVDSSGHGHDGEYKNDVALGRPAALSCERRPHPPRACELAADPQDSSAYFPPRDGYGFANGIAAPQSAYTLEAWVDPADGNDVSILGQGGGGQLFIHGGHLALRQTQDTVYGGGPTLTPGQWWHVAATWDGHTTRLYVDGQEVGSSTSANKPPSGEATFYVGYGDQAPWFHGGIDEAAYYDSALSGGLLHAHYVVGTTFDHPSLGPGPLDTAGPTADPTAPANGGLYAPGKVPAADFTCSDPDGAGDIASCTATVDGAPIADGAPLPDSPGAHEFTVTAVDKGGLTYVHTHTYTVADFASIIRADHPVAYYRLGDTGDTMADASGNGHDGTYKNDQESGPIGISGDGDHARRFEGEGGYGYANGIQAPRYQATLEAWVDPEDSRDESIAGQGDAGELFITGGHFAYRHMSQTVVASVGPNPVHWTQVTGVWDGVTISIYVDGVLRGSVEATERPSSSSTFYVGYGEHAPWFKGAIDEVAYYDTALTPARIYQHFLADPPPAELTPVDAEAVSGGDEPPAGGEPHAEGETDTPSGGSSGAAAASAGSSGASSAPATAPTPAATKPAPCAKRRGIARKICLKHAHRRARHR
ncbi:MAG TPA: LamG-like jellyroll fold domain-containing protein [Solirubrobacterales bacterium]|nr:LamG-like jellyroll fold domain-containing protein [Solirubrobacterales bacterium]